MSARPPATGASRTLLRRVHELDEALYRAVARTSTPALDEPLRRLSSAADYSRLSIASAAVLALAGGARGRRAAVTGLACVAVTATAVNFGGKLLSRRRRPDRTALGVAEPRHVPMLRSSSFPSGHSAAAFAFAEGVRHEWPPASVPPSVVAALVAYSRVHTGVHYPGDVVAGSLIGLGLAQATARVVGRLRRRTWRTGRA